MRTLNRMKLAALAKEFPFLTQLPGYDLEDCNHVVIKRADEHEMNRIPFQHQIISPTTQSSKGDQVFLLDQTGNLLGQVKPTTYLVDYQSNGHEEFAYGETILESIFRQHVYRSVYYIVWVRFGVDQLGDFILPYWHAYIYKPDKTTPVEDTIIDIYHQAEQEVQAELQAAGF